LEFRSWSSVKGQFEFEPYSLECKYKESLASLAVLLDQEEESVQLVPEGLSSELENYQR
jgi:hypothetical protein